jgi:hypothetical protein
MAARSRGVVEKMTRTTTTHPRGELEGPGVWQTLGKKKGGGGGEEKRLESGKLWKKKKYIHTHSYTHVVVHTCMYDGEEA